MAVDLFFYDKRATEVIGPAPLFYAKLMKWRSMEVPAYWRISTLVDLILAMSGGNKIGTLYLMGHGKPGRIQLGSGLDKSSAKEFARLHHTRVFAKNGTIELHSCGVASSTPLEKCQGSYHGGGPGYKFLNALAFHSGVPVEAGIHCQSADSAFGFEGPTVCVYPDGSVLY